jgi:Mn2+/Fe2+ NRAMP family transporter
LASYGYWVNAKGWRTPAWIPMMRFDNSVAYVLTGVFVVAMLVVGAELLYAAQIALGKGDQGLVDLGKILEQRFGPVTSKLFFVGFFAVTFSSLLGVWEGVSLLFADFVRKLRGPAQSDGVAALEKSNAFRFYVLWLTFPPMLLLLLGKPFALVIAYGAFGAFFMPFLAITLLLLLNREGVPHAWRSGVWSNGLLVVAALLFVVLCVNEIAGMF